MDVWEAQVIPQSVRNADRRMVDQLNRLNVGTQDNGQNSGGSHKNENISIKRKELQAINRRTNIPLFQQPSARKISEDNTRVDLMKPGDCLKNRWRILRKIGGGGFGEIYEAVDTQIDLEKMGRGRSEMSELCSFCAVNRDNYVKLPNTEGGMHQQHCTECGRDLLSSSATFIFKKGLQRQSSEDALESVDSGNSSGYSERGSVSENYVVAVKSESNTQSKQMLHMEVAVLRKLKDRKNFCNLLACGKTQRINYVVMTLQGKNLSELRKKAPNGCFTRSTSLRIICKCLDAVEELHSIGYLHRDIKPSNFCLRRNDPTEICLLDFGLVRPFMRSGSTNQIRPPRASAGFRGTVRYASINAHNYRELGRHDDLWSMYYMLVEFFSGRLPWHRKSEKDVVKKIKTESKPVDLGVNSGLPQTIANSWVHQLSNLSYYITPSYRELRKIIELWLSANGVEWNEPYDWQRQPMTGAEAVTTLTPMFKQNQPPGRQFVQNGKRSTYHESTGCLKRLDKRGFGSTVELKRFESEGLADGTTAFGGRSTAALCEDAITNKNMATEKIMREDDEEHFDEASDKLDERDKLMGSHIDLSAIRGEQRKPAENVNLVFPISSKPLDTPPEFMQIKASNFNRFPFLLSPSPMPSRPPGDGSGKAFLQPENKSLLPPLYPVPPVTHPSEDPQKHLYFLPLAYRQRRGLSDVVGSTNAMPTPKPRSRHAELDGRDHQEEELDSDPSEWLCRDDIRGGFRAALLTGPYLQKPASQNSFNYNYTTRLSEMVKSRFASTEYLEVAPPASAMERQGAARTLQQYRSVTTLNFPSSESPSIRTSQGMLNNEDDSRARRAWLPIVDGRTRSGPGEMIASEMPEGIRDDIIHRPTTQTMNEKSGLVWQPINYRQKVETPARRFEQR